MSTHFIYPEVPGFQQAGGAAGFGQDFVSHPDGDMTVACKYMKMAGYPNCKYTGQYGQYGSVLIVGSNTAPGPQEMQVVQSGLTALGFKTSIKAVPQQTMYSKFCGYVKAHVNVCPTAGWIEDFPDPYAALYVPFSGKAIVPINNSNWASLNDPAINDALNKDAGMTNLTARYQACAQVDKMIVDYAAAIPEVWSDNALLEGRTSRASSIRGTTIGTSRTARRAEVGSRIELDDPEGPRARGAPGSHRHGPLHHPPSSLGHRDC